jgi:chromosome segregation ATPase
MLKSFLRSVVLLALIAAVVLLGQKQLESHSNASALEDEIRVLHGRVRRMHIEYAELEQIAAELRTEIVAYSNQLEAARAQLSEEHATHEPLRRQIETMSSAEIRLRAQVQTHSERVRELSAELAQATTASTKSLSKTQQKLSTAEQGLTASTATLADAKSEIEKLKSDLASTLQQRTELESTIKQIQRQLEEKTQSLSAAQARIEALQKLKPMP